MKACIHCGVPQPKRNFYRHVQMSDGRLNKCKSCCKLERKSNYAAKREQYRQRDKERNATEKRKSDKLVRDAKYRRKHRKRLRALNKQWRLEHPQLQNMHTAVRRARRARACPVWVSKVALRYVYEKCPKGKVVDHIVPLKHDLVCGLHVPWNLQYLTPRQNAQKGNKFTINER